MGIMREEMQEEKKTKGEDARRSRRKKPAGDQSSETFLTPDTRSEE